MALTLVNSGCSTEAVTAASTYDLKTWWVVPFLSGAATTAFINGVKDHKTGYVDRAKKQYLAAAVLLAGSVGSAVYMSMDRS